MLHVHPYSHSCVSEADIGGKSCSFILCHLVLSTARSAAQFTSKPSEGCSCKRSDAAVSSTSTTPGGEWGRF